VRLAPLLVALALLAPAATIRGTPRADRIDVVGRGADTVGCGRGVDIVTADSADRIARDCEIVSRRISFDTLVGAPGQHQTEVEASVLGFGSMAVATFQVGRFADRQGGAAGIGWATSRDAGRTWRSGVLPGVTAAGRRATDPVVAFDAAQGQWLISTLINGTDVTAVGISRSRDGVTWSPPVFAAHIPFATISFDKEWIACDNGSTSPFFGSCYLAYTELSLFTPRLAFQVSRDGGATWGEAIAATAPFGSGVNGALPLVQPDGALTIVFNAREAVHAVRSTDGGATFSPPVAIAPLTSAAQPGLRAPSLPTAAVDAAGRLYVAWADCRFRAGCGGNDVVLSTSMDGATWAGPTRVPGAGIDSFVPGIAAHPRIPGRISIVTHVRRTLSSYGVAVTSSRNGGVTWTSPQRLDAVSPRYTWLAQAAGGAFVGDYVGATFAGVRFVPVFALAQRPLARGRLRQYMMAASLP